MSYSNQGSYGELPPIQEVKTPRRGGCNPVFFIIIAAVLFFVFSNVNRPPQGDPNWDSEANSVEPFESSELPSRSRGKRPAQSGWEMEQVDAVPSSTPAAQPKSPTTNQDGWSMEGVETNGGSENTKPNSKKTKKGDWEFEEVGK